MTPDLATLADEATLDLLPDPIFVVGPGGQVAAVNDLARRLLGRDPVGEHAPTALVLRDEAGNDWWETDRPLERDPGVHQRIPERDLWLYGAPPRPVTLTGACHRADDGVALVLCLRRAERRQRLDAARSDLVATVSHELRSPLTAVKGFTKTLLAKWDRFPDEQKQQMLMTVNADADRVTRLLTELLDVSRIDAGRLKLRRAVVDLSQIAHRVVERVTAETADASASGRRDAEIVVHDPGDLPAAFADEDKLEQVLINLVENAVKYGAGRIEVALGADDEELSVVVTDEGGAIAREHLDHIFTKFYRQSGERRTGTGLGLYISKGIVEAHGGRIWAESDAECGTRFHVRLPRRALEAALSAGDGARPG